jgi:HNH endonuclease
VSSCGRVRRGAFEVASWPNAKGYHLVSLELPGRDRPVLRYVHRLVLTAFRGRPAAHLQGHHGDGAKGHNTLDNLAWVTPAGNVAFAVRLRLERAGQQSLPL